MPLMVVTRVAGVAMHPLHPRETQTVVCWLQHPPPCRLAQHVQAQPTNTTLRTLTRTPQDAIEFPGPTPSQTGRDTHAHTRTTSAASGLPARTGMLCRCCP